MRIRVLGSAAGGGVPQWNCGCDNCVLARRGERVRPRTQDSLLVTGERGNLLVNASPDVLRQIEATPSLWPRAPRDTPIAAIVLTNGDLDHVLGLFSLRESQPLVVYATDRVWRGLMEEHDLAHARALRRPDHASTPRRSASAATSPRRASRSSPSRRRASCQYICRARRIAEDNVGLRVEHGAKRRDDRDRAEGRGRRPSVARRVRRRSSSTARSSRATSSCAGSRARARRGHGAPAREGRASRRSRACSSGARSTRTSTTRTRSCAKAPTSARGSSPWAGRSRSTAWRSTRERPRRTPPRASARRATTTSIRSTSRCTAASSRDDADPRVGAESLLLPDADPHQRRDHPLEERGPRVSPRVDPAHRRSRRRAAAGSLSGTSSRRASGSTWTRCGAFARCLPGVRFACDAYVSFVRERPLLEASRRP